MFLLVNAWQGTVNSSLEQSTIRVWYRTYLPKGAKGESSAKSSEGEDTSVHMKQLTLAANNNNVCNALNKIDTVY